MRIVVLDAFTTDQGDADAWRGLAAHGEQIVHPRTASADLVARCAGAEAVLTNKAPLDAATIAALPALRYVGVLGTGYNVVDVDTCRARGIAVCNVPGYSTGSVAQHVFALVLHLVSDVAGHAARARAGRWARSPDFCFFTRPLVELAGLTLVVIGSGAIGSAVARIGAGFGLRVIAAAVPGSATPGRTPLAEALPQADLVSLHCPLVPRTRHLVDDTFLAAIKPGAILINTGRGALVDEAALTRALASGQLGGAGLDVLSDEPPALDHPLLRADAPWADRLVVTPHIAWGTVAARARLVAAATANLAAWRAGQRLNRVD